MATSQNVSFRADVKPDPEFEHPDGAALTRLLAVELRNVGWVASNLENWRDSGWSIIASCKDAYLIIVLGRWKENDNWLLQIAPKDAPGFVSRLVGEKPSASSA